jgi:hypothetical protein
MNSLRGAVKRLASDPESVNGNSQYGSSHVVSDLTKPKVQILTEKICNAEFLNDSTGVKLYKLSYAPRFHRIFFEKTSKKNFRNFFL